MSELTLICPRHGGSYDCSPFCDLCEGQQEFTARPFTELELMGRPVLALRLDNVYRIAKHLETDFGLERGLGDDLTKALEELQRELNEIITKRESK